MNAQNDLEPYRVNAWSAPPHRPRASRLHADRTCPEPGLRARFAMIAAFRPLGLTIVDGIVRPDSLIVHLLQDIPTPSLIEAGFTLSTSERHLDGCAVTLQYPAQDANLAEILSLVSRLGNLIAAHGGNPDTATALDVVIEVYNRA